MKRFRNYRRSPVAVEDEDINYVVVIDAGSSGSRVHVYQWHGTQDTPELQKLVSENGNLPVISTPSDRKAVKKVHPGISSFDKEPSKVWKMHLKKLVKFAESVVPEDKIPSTPIFLQATAGMRLLSEESQRAILDETCKALKTKTKFHVSDCSIQVQVIDGETEGLYGWLSLNYLLKGFRNDGSPDGHPTFGFMDMGGASAQIAFVPNRTETEKHLDNLSLVRVNDVDGNAKEWNIFVSTWLGYGANQARERYLASLLEGLPAGGDILKDPCLLKNANMTWTSPKDNREYHIVGTGSYESCVEQTYPLTGNDIPCDEDPCILAGVHAPAIDFNVNHFVGVSEYWHVTEDVFHMGGGYNFETYDEKVKDFCNSDWEAVLKDFDAKEYGDKLKFDDLDDVCFKSVYVINMLHEGFNIPRLGIDGSPSDYKHIDLSHELIRRGYGDPFQSAKEINGVDLSWTLGSALLYASSRMSLSNHASKPVGFGPNNHPESFMEIGKVAAAMSLTDETDVHWWKSMITASDYSRAFFFLCLLLIIVVVLFLITGKTRRRQLLLVFKASIYDFLVAIFGQRWFLKSHRTSSWAEGLDHDNPEDPLFDEEEGRNWTNGNFSRSGEGSSLHDRDTGSSTEELELYDLSSQVSNSRKSAKRDIIDGSVEADAVRSNVFRPPMSRKRSNNPITGSGQGSSVSLPQSQNGHSWDHLPKQIMGRDIALGSGRSPTPNREGVLMSRIPSGSDISNRFEGP